MRSTVAPIGSSAGARAEAGTPSYQPRHGSGTSHGSCQARAVAFWVGGANFGGGGRLVRIRGRYAATRERSRCWCDGQ